MSQAANSIQRVAANRGEFDARLLIDTAKGPRRLADVIEPWQERDEAALEPSLQAVIGNRQEGVRMRAYLERARGHDKTGFCARTAIRTLAARNAPGSAVWVASDRDQAALGRDAINRLLTFNEPLRKFIDCGKDKVTFANGSQLDIISSDAGSAYGRLDDVIIVDELTNWKDNAQPLWEAMISTAPKRNALVLVISNAGYQDGWQWKIREAARTSPDWIFSRLEGPVASWITPAQLDEQRRFLPRMAYDRLWNNLWVSAAGDAISTEDIQASFARNLPQLSAPEPGFAYVGALDLGVSRDWSAFVVVGRSKDGRLRVAQVKVAKPTPGGKVDLATVAGWVLEAQKIFRLRAVAADPFQASLMVQQLQKQGVRIAERSQTGQALVEQAMAVIESFSSRAIDCCDHPGLRYDLEHLRLEARNYGWRLVSDRGPEGHGDIASALSIALATAKVTILWRSLAIGGGTLEAAVSGDSPWDRKPSAPSPETIGEGHIRYHQTLAAALNDAASQP